MENRPTAGATSTICQGCNSTAARAGYVATQQNTRLLLGLAALLSLIGTAGIYFMFFRRVTLPLQRAVRVAERIASGNLTRQTQTHNSGEAESLMRA